MGYPGKFTQLQNSVYLKAEARVVENSTIRWEGPDGRTQLLINGKGFDVTRRKMSLKPGSYEITAVIDFTDGLPCFIFEGAGLSSPGGWQVSLDGKNWTEPEYFKAFNNPLVPPDRLPTKSISIPVAEILNASNVMASGGTCEFGANGEAVFDFRHIELGRLKFDATGEGELLITVGESVAETTNTEPLFFEQKPLSPVKLSLAGQSVVLPERCLRYARIKTTEKCTVKNLEFIADTAPVEYAGAFSCNDDKLNAIWQEGAATIHSCMHDFYLDGIKRDGLSWSYDGLIGIEGGDCVFFDRRVARNTIISQLLPVNPTKADVGILDYPLYAVFGFRHEYEMSGDTMLLRRYKSRIYELLDFYLGLQNNKGFVSGKGFINWGFFPDWAGTTSVDTHGTPTYAQILLMKALEDGKYIAAQVGDVTMAGKYDSAAASLRTNIRKYFWDDTRGAFINGYDSEGRTDNRLTSFAQVWGILFDLIAPAEYDRVFKSVLDNPACHKFMDGQVAQNQFYEMKARFKAGRGAEAVGRFREIWSRMVDAGLARFIEDINLDLPPAEQLAFYGRTYGKSLCHVWAGALPVYVLSREVLGIKPVTPGGAECSFEPMLAGLKWIKGAVPVPSGVIAVELDESGGKLVVPAGVRVVSKSVMDTSGQSIFLGPASYDVKWKK